MKKRFFRDFFLCSSNIETRDEDEDIAKNLATTKHKVFTKIREMENSVETENKNKEEFEKIETEEKSSTDQSADKSNQDYYQILGIPRDATEKQINAAYKKLALQYHPDRNSDKEAAEVKFRELNDAYHVLIDPNKRRQYDLRGDKTTNEFESVDVSTLGGIGRVFGAMISRLGIPIPTQISQDILTTAQTICR